MNIAMIGGTLAAAGSNNPVSGLDPLAGTDNPLNFAALLSAAGKMQGLSGTELSAELQAFFAGRNDIAAEDGKPLNLASLLLASREGTDGKAALLQSPAETDSSRPAEDLLAAIAQALTGQSAKSATEGRLADKSSGSATSDDESPSLNGDEIPLAAMITPALTPNVGQLSGALDSETMSRVAAGSAEDRLFFPVDRSSLQSGGADQPAKDAATPASNFAETANTAAGVAFAASAARPPHDAPLAIASPLHERSAWTQDFGDRIVWMAKQDQQSADIRITPANLGPVQISLNIEDGKANAVFASPHAEVRQAIEEALPRLREMLNTAGISLGQANVGSQMPQQQFENTAAFAAAPRSTGENAILSRDEGSSVQTVATPLNRGRGLVDLFA